MKHHISRRDSLKYITLASLSAGVLGACDPKTTTAEVDHAHMHAGMDGINVDYLSEADLALLNQTFFTDHERETVRVLANLIIPADEHSGNAEEAGVVPFIEFMMLDEPSETPAFLAHRALQTKMRGGLRWIDLQSLERFEKAFIDGSEEEQTSILDDIAYPETARPEMKQGVAFFNTFRNFVASGFWSSKIGIEDLQYKGNVANLWDGAPQEWLDRLGVSYDV